MNRKRMAIVLVAFLATGGGVVGSTIARSQGAQERLNCPGGITEVYSYTLGALADGSIPEVAGSETDEAAVEDEAQRSMESHERGARRHEGQGRTFTVRRDGRDAAIFAVGQLSNSRYIVEGGEICAEDSKRR